MKKVFLALVLCLSLATSGASAAISGSSSQATGTGSKGQKLTVSQTKGLENGSTVKVTGSNYDMKLGIYVTFCVMPKKGKKPELCGAYNMFGGNTQAFWISSNPPFYAAALVTPFNKGGKFSVNLLLTKTTAYKGADCTKVQCAVLTRADHTNGSNRTADVFVPIFFTK
jgi:hypothetical protein